MNHDPTEKLLEMVKMDGLALSRGTIEIFGEARNALNKQGGDETARRAIELASQGKQPEDISVKTFNNLSDWLMALLIVGIMKAFPDFTPKQAMGLSKELFRQLAHTRQEAKWIKTLTWVEKIGIKSALAQVMMELSKGYWD